MLKVSVKEEKNIIELPPLQPGDRPGTMTDYSKPGNEVLVFLCTKSNRAYLLVSREGYQVDYDEFSMLSSQRMDKIAELRAHGEIFVYPFETTRGKASLVLQLL